MAFPCSLEDMDHPETDERIPLIALALTRGIGWKLIHRLLRRFGSYSAVLAASTEDLRTVQGVGPQIAARIRAIDAQRVAADLHRFAAQQITVSTWLEYPAWLTSLN